MLSKLAESTHNEATPPIPAANAAPRPHNDSECRPRTSRQHQMLFVTSVAIPTIKTKSIYQRMLLALDAAVLLKESAFFGLSRGRLIRLRALPPRCTDVVIIFHSLLPVSLTRITELWTTGPHKDAICSPPDCYGNCSGNKANRACRLCAGAK